MREAPQGLRSMRVSGLQVLPKSQEHPPPPGLLRHLLQLFPEPLCQLNKTGMDSGSPQYGTLADWLQSDVFIVFVVVMVLLGLVLTAVCWVWRRQRRSRQSTLQRLTEIEIYPVVDGSVGEAQQQKFSLKIRTDQRHASELVGILADHIRPTGSHATGEMSTGVSASKATLNPTVTPTQPLETQVKKENIGVAVITSKTTIPGVFIPQDYNSSSDSNDDQNDNDDCNDESESD
ncbi:uncharacterized protein si:dkey-111e8.4 [Alosa alosa]|uniref:uncharacterized protein si:dkey-111e8.4 n=1 Tax=Alosa alosa TaxID=278164 RepID=UPI0020152062|nr:uncharacterized protein si:dkey-111e8.4 [Alosa alosa]